MVVAHVGHLLDDVQLHQAAATLQVAAERGQPWRMLVRNVFHMAQPVVGQAGGALFHHRLHAATAIVADDHHMFDLQHLHRELQHRQAVQVAVHHQVGDVAMHEHLAGVEADDLVGRHAAVGAADPQKARRLLPRQPAEELGVVIDALLGPGAVVGKQAVEAAHDYIASAYNSRPMSMRRISDVPAPISYSLASRHSRPAG